MICDAIDNYFALPYNNLNDLEQALIKLVRPSLLSAAVYNVILEIFKRIPRNRFYAALRVQNHEFLFLDKTLFCSVKICVRWIFFFYFCGKKIN